MWSNLKRLITLSFQKTTFSEISCDVFPNQLGEKQWHSCNRQSVRNNNLMQPVTFLGVILTLTQVKEYIWSQSQIHAICKQHNSWEKTSRTSRRMTTCLHLIIWSSGQKDRSHSHPLSLSVFLSLYMCVCVCLYGCAWGCEAQPNIFWRENHFWMTSWMLHPCSRWDKKWQRNDSHHNKAILTNILGERDQSWKPKLSSREMDSAFSFSRLHWGTILNVILITHWSH